MLEAVKKMLGITGSYQDGLLNLYINEIKEYLSNAGVSKSIIEDPTSYGLIARGVLDIWNYGAGEGKLSNYFMQRTIQLAVKGDIDVQN